jgi:drug/metabolite transporter (DMT)-like permease
MTPERRATLWLLSMCTIWGSSFWTMKAGQEPLAAALGARSAAPAFLFLRFLVAAALFPLIFPRAVRGLTRGTVAAGVLLSLPFGVGFYLQVKGLQDTTATISAFLTNLTVVLTPALGRLFFRETLRWANVAGAAIALAGVYVLTDPRGGAFGIGEILTAFSAVAWSVQIQLTNIVTRKHRPESVTFIMFVMAVIYFGAALAVLGTDGAALARACLVPRVAWTVVFTATVCSIAAITIMNRFQRDLPPTRASVIYTLEPVFAAAFAAWGGEAMTSRKLLGGAIIIGGNLVCEMFHARSRSSSSGDEAAGAGP